MNQFLFFRFIQIHRRRSSIVFNVLLMVLLVNLPVSGQENGQAFQPPTEQPSFQGNWQAANALATASHESPGTWPNEIVTFDAQVKQTRFDTKTTSPVSLESAIDSTGATLSRLKKAVASKTNGWLGSTSSKQAGAGGLNIPKMLGSLSLVLGCYFGFVWLMRKISPAANSQLPSEVVQIIGRTSFGSRQHLQLVRLGSKLVLLLNGPEGTHPIGEVTDPEEVRHLISLCGSKQSGRPTFFARSSTPATRQTAPAAESVNAAVTPGLANVLCSLEKVAKQHGGSVFEA
jgi:flagellar biogenesis protein FliO